MNIWNHAADYAVARSAPLTWMTSIVRNRCLDWLRRPQQEATGDEYDIAVETWRDDAPGPMEQLLASSEAGRAGAVPGQAGKPAAANHHARLFPSLEPFGTRRPDEAAARHVDRPGAHTLSEFAQI